MTVWFDYLRHLTPFTNINIGSILHINTKICVDEVKAITIIKKYLIRNEAGIMILIFSTSPSLGDHPPTKID